MGRQRGKRAGRGRGHANERPGSTTHTQSSTRAGPLVAAASSSPTTRPRQAPGATESASPPVAAGSASIAIIQPNPRATHRSTYGHPNTSRYPLRSSNRKVGARSGSAPKQEAQSAGPIAASDSVAKRQQVSQPDTTNLQVPREVDVPKTDSSAQAQRGKKRRASNDHPDEPQAKNPTRTALEALSNLLITHRRSAHHAAPNTSACAPAPPPPPPLRAATSPSTIRTLNPSPGTILQIRVVEHQKDNQPAPTFHSSSIIPSDQKYFTIGNERFCSKWRFHLITNILPDGVRCAPMFTHNSMGLRGKSRKLKKGYVSVRDMRAFPANMAFKGEGDAEPLRTEKMCGTWRLKEMAVVKLGFVEWGFEKEAYLVGRIGRVEVRRLRMMLDEYTSSGG